MSPTVPFLFRAAILCLHFHIVLGLLVSSMVGGSSLVVFSIAFSSF